MGRNHQKVREKSSELNRIVQQAEWDLYKTISAVLSACTAVLAWLKGISL